VSLSARAEILPEMGKATFDDVVASAMLEKSMLGFAKVTQLSGRTAGW
jgi:hypothetical protein